MNEISILSQVQICKLRSEVKGLEACIGCPVAEEYGCSTQDDRFNQMCNITAANPDAFPDVEQGEAIQHPRCSCGAVPDHFTESAKGTLYWCSECLDFETMEKIFEFLGVRQEIGDYDASLENLCKHWIGTAQLCGHDDMKFIQQRKSEDCGGLLANCKVPQYKTEQSH